MKYIFITSGSFSGIGKGSLASSIGVILQSYGYTVTFLKMEPYLNYSAGKLEPSEHGETFVLADGTETDLDLGHYQRLCGLMLDSSNSLTSGKILHDLISGEKSGSYNGKTLRFCKDFNEYIFSRIRLLESKPVYDITGKKLGMPDILIIQLGGTVGDDETLFPIKAFSRFFSTVSQSDKCFISLDYTIEIGDVTKTKLLQNSMNNLSSFGLTDDILIYKGNKAMEATYIEKVSINCGLKEENIIWAGDSPSQYAMPETLQSHGLYTAIKETLCLEDRPQMFLPSRRFELLTRTYDRTRRIGIISRYNTNDKPYTSLDDALLCAGKLLGYDIEIVMINYIKLASEDVETFDLLRSVDGIVLPGGFGDLNVDTKVMVAQYARTNNIPFLGICLGFQIMTIEYARNVLGMRGASSEEFGTPGCVAVVRKHPNIVCHNTGEDIFLGKYVIHYSGMFRDRIYKAETYEEPFRHRYSLNPAYEAALEAAGLRIEGRTADNRAVAVCFEDNKFYCGIQYHPELNSTTERVDPVIRSFVESLNETKN